MFKEQIEWACQEGADFIVAETFHWFGEAMLALECIKKYGKGVPSVVTLGSLNNEATGDGIPYPEATKRLEDAGADVVGLICWRGPETIMPIIKKIRGTCKGPIAALPVPYRTTKESSTFWELQNTHNGLRERLLNGGNVLVAEGYVFEFERKGYLQAGCFVPEVVLEHPDLVRSLHEEYVHAGSDVVLAFTYYGHRAKMAKINQEDMLEKLNVDALKIGRQVADKTGTLMAGNICNTGVYETGNKSSIETVEAMFKEQIEWACQEGADFIVAETINNFGEAMLALDSIKKYGQGLPAVITIAAISNDATRDGVPYTEALRKLEENGADVVGFNCVRGPETMMPILRSVRCACKGPIAALPVPYRTTPDHPNFFTLQNTHTGKNSFPIDLQSHMCFRSQIEEFARESKSLGVQYVGLCCGNSSNNFRIISEEYGRHPPASRFSPDMSKHIIFGDDTKQKNQDIIAIARAAESAKD